MICENATECRRNIPITAAIKLVLFISISLEGLLDTLIPVSAIPVAETVSYVSWETELRTLW